MSSYKSIFKTSMLTGGSQFLVLFFNMLRSKVIAVILGPAGTGIIGLYTSVTQLANTISAVGLNNSAVRQIAQANKDDDKAVIGRTLFVYRTLIRCTTIVAAIIMVILAEKISILSFDTDKYTSGVRWMAIVVFFTGISNGQLTLLQGLRRIKDLALARILGALAGAVVSILLIWVFKERGIIPYLIAGSALSILISWYFAVKIGIPAIRVNLYEFKAEAKKLLGMGFAFLITGLAISFMGYYSRALISQHFTLESVGLYTASWTLSAIYVNFVLNAMGADFYPRLAGVIEDHNAAKEIINEQTNMGITLASTGIIAVIAFSGLFLKLFYSSKFLGATNLLQWMTLGMAIKVISWPLGYIIISKGKAFLFTLTELTWVVLFIGLLNVFVRLWGIEGAGIAFFLTYFIHTILIFIVGKVLIGFKWQIHTIKQIVQLSFASMLVFIVSRILTGLWPLLINILIVMTILVYNYFQINKLLDENVLIFIKNKIHKKPKN